MKEKHEHLDKIIDEVVKATSPSEDEIVKIAESPFLFRRIRVRIEQENKSDNSILSFWSDLFQTFKLATKVTATVALLVIFVFVLIPKSSQQKNSVASNTPVLDELANDELFAEVVGLPASVKIPNEVRK